MLASAPFFPFTLCCSCYLSGEMRKRMDKCGSYGCSRVRSRSQGAEALKFEDSSSSKQGKAWVLSECRMEYGRGLHLPSAL